MMASSHARVVLVVMVAMVIISVLEAAAAAEEDTHVSEHCKREYELMVKECDGFYECLKPSESCCRMVRSIKEDCVCHYMTPSVVAKIGAERLIELVRGCGRRVPHHAKCGCLNFP